MFEEEISTHLPYSLLGEIYRSPMPFGKYDPDSYQAFQVPLNIFTEGKDIHQAILDNVVAVLKELPGWE